MKNFILKYKFFYRLYQKIIRKSKNEYDFIKFVFKKNKLINVLDICCGDSYILNYIKPNISNYIGIDNNENYLTQSRRKYPKFRFINCDIEKISQLKEIKNADINFIFLNGAIHHFNDKIVQNLLFFINSKYPLAKFLSIDPLKDNNKFISKIMINMDRGKFIRNQIKYKKLMKNFDSLITKDFFLMEFLLIFHSKNINLSENYKEWKNDKTII